MGEVEAHLTAATNWERKRTIERWIAVGTSHIRSLAPSEGPRGSATTGGIPQTFARRTPEWSLEPRSRAGSKPVKNPDRFRSAKTAFFLGLVNPES